MYFKEAIIDNVLCYKTSPDGNWIAYTSEQLTKKLQEHTKYTVGEKFKTIKELNDHADFTIAVFKNDIFESAEDAEKADALYKIHKPFQSIDLANNLMEAISLAADCLGYVGDLDIVFIQK
jgi:hypothetical protein